MTGIGPEFLKLLRGIEWDTLTARDAVDLRAALKEAVGKSDEWFRKLTQDFGGVPVPAVERVEKPQPPTPAKVEDGRPGKVLSPREPKPARSSSSKRKRGRPLPRPNPIVIGGANAQTAGTPAAAKLFENSYVSKEGPRADIPASLPADHPRLNIHRETSVTPEQDVEDFKTVERAMATGRGVKDIFEVR